MAGLRKHRQLVLSELNLKPDLCQKKMELFSVCSSTDVKIHSNAKSMGLYFK
jgi:hypothetical protein